MARPELPPVLQPRQPRTVLRWSMQKQREVHFWSIKETAKRYGCSTSHISRVEHGKMPSRELVRFYDETFGTDGLLMSLYEAVVQAPEDERRRAGSRRPLLPVRSTPGDAAEFVSDTVPHGSQMSPGQLFLKTWCVRNSGSVPWQGRQLQRQGPLTGPGLITSPPLIPITDTGPGELVRIHGPLKAPTYDCASIAYFKMVDADGRLCFPDNYQLGLDVLVSVRGQLPDKPIESELGNV